MAGSTKLLSRAARDAFELPRDQALSHIRQTRAASREERASPPMARLTDGIE